MIKIREVERRYLVTAGSGEQISVIVAKDRLSLYRYQFFNEGFEFVGSDQTRVRRVAELLLAAASLAEIPPPLEEP